MRGYLALDASEFECNEGEKPPLEALEKKKLKPQSARAGDRVLAMELEAVGTSIHIPVPEKARGRMVRITVEVLK